MPTASSPEKTLKIDAADSLEFEVRTTVGSIDRRGRGWEQGGELEDAAADVDPEDTFESAVSTALEANGGSGCHAVPGGRM